ncbi:E3 ubiquitin-protein ligase TRIM39-like [Microcaecilia unicolor]|uniref:E3 ubiquitin-protein ligase TRIM39-like n=1 Tax=Microcaecilia unicolor TaxID=1415580 RepID=A0A6P7XJM8_9AMPH|nr:E3 ubiquitin-protein ligase TRIM39-like [Microcaecilia unicolor]
MAASSTAESLQEETSCPICLDYFTDPVITECGHNFCRSCITESWERIEINFPCPQCRETSLQRNLRPNRQLANITAVLKTFSERNEAENLCEKHEEKLKLFCTEEEKAICVICKEGKDHRSHSVIPIEEAMQEYKEKYEIHLEPLKKKLKEILKLKTSEQQKTEQLMHKTKREKILSEFEELHKFLNEEQQILLSRMEEEEKEILKKISDNVTHLEDQSSFLKKLISEIEEKCQQSATELLKDAKSTLSRCQTVEFPRPEAVCTEMKLYFHLMYPRQYFIVKKMLRRHQGKVSAELVNVTLDPETAHPNLILSEDQKSVRLGDTRQKLLVNPQRFDPVVSVLGCENFTSGRHYWEVEVGDKTDWDLGVCKDSVSRKGEIIYTPRNGYWTVILRHGHKYKASTSPDTLLHLSVRPRAVGIFLDYEVGKVSFYNADNKSHLFTFTDTFTEKLRPYFNPFSNMGGKNAASLRIRPVDWE